MKLKYYLRGVGLGVLFATIVLSVTFHLNKTTIDDISERDVIKKAEELGMTFADAESTEDAAETEVVEQDTEADVDQTEELLDPPEGYTPLENSILLPVEEGMGWRDIGNILVEANIIEDSDDFWTYVYRNAPRKVIHTGEFEIPMDADYDMIISIITN